MPRRYQPPVKRRKTKKARAPGLLEIPADDSPPEAAAHAPGVSVTTAELPHRAEERHITRDYSYVIAEVRRVAFVAGFIIVSLILTAVFLR